MPMSSLLPAIAQDINPEVKGLGLVVGYCKQTKDILLLVFCLQIYHPLWHRPGENQNPIAIGITHQVAAMAFTNIFTLCEWRHRRYGTTLIINTKSSKDKEFPGLPWLTLSDQPCDLLLIRNQRYAGINFEAGRYCRSPKDGEMEQLKAGVVREFNSDAVRKGICSRMCNTGRNRIHPLLLELGFIPRQKSLAIFTKQSLEVPGLYFLCIASNRIYLVLLILDGRVSEIRDDVRPTKLSHLSTQFTYLVGSHSSSIAEKSSMFRGRFYTVRAKTFDTSFAGGISLN